jgi:hypothetical protein
VKGESKKKESKKETEANREKGQRRTVNRNGLDQTTWRSPLRVIAKEYFPSNGEVRNPGMQLHQDLMRRFLQQKVNVERRKNEWILPYNWSSLTRDSPTSRF